MQHQEILHRCFRCGYCKLPGNYVDLNCPSYAKYRFETFSPGGRMWLLYAWVNKKIEPGKRFQEIMFSCASCGNCVEHCTLPKIKDYLLEAFTAGKEELVNNGTVPPAVRDCLTKAYNHGNMYGLSKKKRGDWANGLNIEPYSDQEYLFYVGDVGSYDPRGQEIAGSVASLLKKEKISFGILGKEELCDGNDAKAMGEGELFKHLAEENIKKFNSLGVSKIITLSPHAFNAMKNDYPFLEGSITIFHYSQILERLVGNFKFKNSLETVKVTFHDPCYLGRHNMEYASVRKTLAAIPGVVPVEMDRCLQNSLCCGGGGGNVFTDILGGGPESPARSRIQEAAETGAQILAVACPVCAVMFEDAVKAGNAENNIEVKEISEIINERLA
ncbi:MAG: (Fe-S)-binding protein [Deltaproteobacteria bacterium]|nr:(Fe-S)-binding protein [Deltaproteobacteria bacterium]